MHNSMLETLFNTKPATKSKNLFGKIEEIARKTKLIVRKSRKFNAESFLLSLLNGCCNEKTLVLKPQSFENIRIETDI